MIKIVQITDLHVGMPDEDSRGVDVRRNTRTILKKLQADLPDQVIITGDLCLNAGRRDTYEWIREELKQVNAPFSFLSGNHDNPVLLAEVFGFPELLKDGELYYQTEWNEHPVICLDTSPGRMSKTQKKWLQDLLSSKDHPQLIFMHHPPVPAGMPFMDHNHSFRQQEELRAILSKATRPLHIFCGHYHTECTIRDAGFTVYITPSTYFQIDRNFTEFQVADRHIAYRWIEWDGGLLRTGVRYFEGTGMDS